MLIQGSFLPCVSGVVLLSLLCQLTQLLRHFGSQYPLHNYRHVRNVALYCSVLEEVKSVVANDNKNWRERLNITVDQLIGWSPVLPTLDTA